MKESSKVLLIIGLIALGIVIYNWTNVLNTVVTGSGQTDLYGNTYWAYGDSPEEAASERAGINQKYGLWLAFVCIGTITLTYLSEKTTIFDPSNYNNENEGLSTTVESNNNEDIDQISLSSNTEQNNPQSEIELLKAKIKELEKKIES